MHPPKYPYMQCVLGLGFSLIFLPGFWTEYIRRISVLSYHRGRGGGGVELRGVRVIINSNIFAYCRLISYEISFFMFISKEISRTEHQYI